MYKLSSTMITWPILRFASDESGATAIEYAMIASGVGVAIDRGRGACIAHLANASPDRSRCPRVWLPHTLFGVYHPQDVSEFWPHDQLGQGAQRCDVPRSVRRLRVAQVMRDLVQHHQLTHRPVRGIEIRNRDNAGAVPVFVVSRCGGSP